MMSKPFLSEKELVQGCIRGDRDAQQELYARYAARLYALCLRYVGDSEESRDRYPDYLLEGHESSDGYIITLQCIKADCNGIATLFPC